MKSQVSHLQKNLRHVAEVVNVDITSSRTHDYPFTVEITVPPLLDKYKPPSIPPYDGRGDPDDYLEMYTRHMLLYEYAEEIMCRAFQNHLTDFTRRWFWTLTPDSISSWEELKEVFSLQFIKRMTGKVRRSRLCYNGYDRPGGSNGGHILYEKEHIV